MGILSEMWDEDAGGGRMIEGTVSLKCSRCNHCEVCQWVDLKMNGCDWFEEEPRTGWIPVSKRLPKEHLCDDGYVEPSDYVLVWGDHGNYGVSRYWGNRKSKSESPNTYKDWMDLDWVVQKPIAWMPLPEPYKASPTGEEVEE